MTGFMPSVHSDADLTDWTMKAEPGDRAIYFDGGITATRKHVTLAYAVYAENKAKTEPVITYLANTAWRLMERGLIELKQIRSGTGTIYVAEKRAHGSPPIAWRGSYHPDRLKGA